MWYNVVIRSNTNNNELARFEITSLDQARNIAWTLMQSRSWANCFAIGHRATGEVEFAFSPPGTKIQFPVREDSAALNMSPEEIYDGAESSGYYTSQPEAIVPSK